MPQVTPGQDGELLVVYDKLRQGLDSRSSPTDITPSRVPDLANVSLAGGYPARINGSTLVAPGMWTPDAVEPTLHATYADALEETQEDIIGCQNGQVYRRVNGAWESLRRDLSTATDLWWSHKQTGDYLVMTNPEDGFYKYDGIRMLPLGAKHIADFDSDYTVTQIADFEADETWVGGTAELAVFQEGLQARSLTSTGSVVEMTLTPTVPWSLRRGEYIRFSVNVGDIGLLDLANTYLRFGDTVNSNFFTAHATAWGTINNGWNTVTIYKDSFTVGGGNPDWSHIAKVAFGVDATAANTDILIFDDLKVIHTEQWSGGTADTTHVKQGTQGRTLTSSGANATMSLIPPVPWNLTLGEVAAVAGGMDYSTSDYIDFWVYFDSVTGLDDTGTRVNFGDVAGTIYFELPASGWGTLLVGWNHVHVLKSSFTIVGAADWSTIARVYFNLKTTGATINATFDDCYMLFANTMPKCQIVTSWKNMVIGMRPDDAPSSFHFTMVGDVDAYDPNAQYELEGGDGTEITGAFTGYGDTLIMTKSNSVHPVSVRLTGEAYPNYIFSSPRRLTAEHGCDSHRSIVEGGGKWYMWWQGGIYRYTGVGTERVSYLFEPTLATVNNARSWQIVAGSLRSLNTVYWFYPTGTGTTNTAGMSYDYVEQAAIPLEGVSAATALVVRTEGDEALITSGYTGRFLEQNSGTTWDGTHMDARVVLPWSSAGTPHPLVSWHELHIPYETQTSGELLVEYRIARHPREFVAATWVPCASIDMSVTEEYGKAFIGELGRWIQIRVSTHDAPFKVYWPVTLIGVNLGTAV
jgi:hypothetical protein